MISGEVGRFSAKTITLKDITDNFTFDKITGKFTRIPTGVGRPPKTRDDGTAHLIRNKSQVHRFFLSVDKIVVDVLLVSWILEYEVPPPEGWVITPKNGDYSDARIDNLELKLKSEIYSYKEKVSRKRIVNSGLPRGVRRIGNKFRVIISIKNKSEYLGTFDTIKEAETMYNNVRDELYKTGSCYVVINGKGKLLTHKDFDKNNQPV